MAFVSTIQFPVDEGDGRAKVIPRQRQVIWSIDLDENHHDHTGPLRMALISVQYSKHVFTYPASSSLDRHTEVTYRTAKLSATYLLLKVLQQGSAPFGGVVVRHPQESPAGVSFWRKANSHLRVGPAETATADGSSASSRCRRVPLLLWS